MLEREVLVCEALGAVDAGRARTVAVQEVTALTHELGNLFRSTHVSVGSSPVYTFIQLYGCLASRPQHNVRRQRIQSECVTCTLTIRWNLEPLYPCGLPLTLYSPVQNWRKFSAVRGTTSLKSSNVIRPNGSPIVQPE